MDKTLLQFVMAGLPVLPVSADKTPMIFSHKFLDTSLPNEQIYTNVSKCNYALKCGNSQTKIECIDFDIKNDPFKDDSENNIWALFKKECDIAGLYIETSPSGGYHILYRCDTVRGSSKLAYKTGIRGAVIETRGSGGYVVVAPSKGYMTIQGSIYAIPYISMNRVDQIWCACKVLNEQPDKNIKKTPVTAYTTTYNKKHAADVLAVLQSEGWTIDRELPDRYYIRRPGEDKITGTSGTIFKESGVFYCFTSATNYSQDTAYSPYDIIRSAKGYTADQMEREVCNEIGESYIKDLVAEILINAIKLKDFEIKRTLYDTIQTDMIKRGAFFQTVKNGRFGYYFYEQNLYVCDITNIDFCCLMFVLYGLTKTEGYCKKVFEDIKNYSLSSGKIVEIRTYTYQQCGCVYVDNFDGSMYKISDKDVDIVDNGTDGVLFLKSNNMPVVYEPAEINFFDEFFGKISFSQGNISAPEYKALFLFWIISFYFMAMNKPIAVFFGEKGSGKSFIFKKLLYLLFGNISAMKTIPDKKENFVAIITNNKIVVFDNADTGRPWLNDGLATAATGGCESMRELYVTNTEATYDIDCFIGLTSRTPKFTRDDIADRMIIFPVDRFEKFDSEEGIIESLFKNRNVLMSVIFNHIKIALRSIGKQDVSCHTRMGSFENLCRKIKPESEEMFKKIVYEQKDFSEDMFTDVFFNYCQNQVVDIVIKTSHELAEELTEICKKRYLKMIVSSHSVGYKFKKKYDFVEIEKRDTGNRKTDYKLTIKCELKNQSLVQWGT